MSSSLYWEPRDRAKKYLSTDLKFALRKRNDNETVTDEVFSDSEIPYLEGLRDAGVKDAQDLIDAIKKFGCIVVDEEF